MSDNLFVSHGMVQVEHQYPILRVSQQMAQVEFQYPTLRVSQVMAQVEYAEPVPVSGPTQEQLLRHGTWFSGGVKQRMWWAR
jgi:hypothetical protein